VTKLDNKRKREREEELYEERSALGRYRKQTIFFING
jgi:hypothetical protein